MRGEDGSWTYLGDGSHKGKQGHMASAVEELQSRFPCADITRASTVLIDDDRQNIEVRRWTAADLITQITTTTTVGPPRTHADTDPATTL